MPQNVVRMFNVDDPEMWCPIGQTSSRFRSIWQGWHRFGTIQAQSAERLEGKFHLSVFLMPFSCLAENDYDPIWAEFALDKVG